MPRYLALIRKEQCSDYGVDFPDFPGCVSAGRNLEEALIMAREALGLHIEGIISDGGTLPHPSRLDEVMADPENTGALAVLISPPVVKPKTARFSVTFDEDLLKSVDNAAKVLKMSRSSFLAEAARKVITSKRRSLGEKNLNS